MICKDCGLEFPGKTYRPKFMPRHRRMIALLVAGGITDKCEICHAISLWHDEEFNPLEFPLPDPYRERRFDDLTHSVYCIQCRASIKQIPCVMCTMHGRTPNYRTRNEKAVPEGILLPNIKRVSVPTNADPVRHE